MDYQFLFNIALSVVAFLGGWMLSRIYSALDRLDQDVRDMPKNYVTKEDYRHDIAEIKEMLRDLVSRFERLVDRP